MVGIVIVSHSKLLADGVAELAHTMAADVSIAAAGGMEDGSLGTSYQRIRAAVKSVYSDDGVIVLMDMGSAVMTTEMVLEDMEGMKLSMIDCPLVEGAATAAVEASIGTPFEDMAEKLEAVRQMRKL